MEKVFKYPNNDAVRQALKDFEASGYKLETVPLKQLVTDNDLLNNDTLNYHKEIWGGMSPDEYFFDPEEAKYWSYTDAMFAVKSKDGKYKLGNGKHRCRALYNDGYTAVELPVLTEEVDTNKLDFRAMYADVINTFGFTTNPIGTEATYILQKGKFLDTKGPGDTNHQHLNIANYLTEKYGYNDVDQNNGSRFMTQVAKAIRVTCWNNGNGLKGIYLPKKEITDKQYSAIITFITGIIRKVNGENPLIIATMNGSQQIEYTKSFRLAERVVADIEYYYQSGILEGGDMTESLTEDTRTLLINKSKNQGPYKDQSHGKNRFERKKLSKIANTVKQYNKIDMNDLFKNDTLQINVPVIGETDTYEVTIKMEGVIKELAKNIKNNQNKLEFRSVIQAVTKIFNTSDVYVRCTCKDYIYNFEHWNIINNVSTAGSDKDPGPGKGIANPNDDKGRGCKHILLVLANTDWLMKVSSTIKNYIFYAADKLRKPFLNVIFPKLYGITADAATEQNLVPEDCNLETDTDIIDTINDWAKNRGKYTKGTNKNPAAGKGTMKGPEPKEEPKEEPEKEPEKAEENTEEETK